MSRLEMLEKKIRTIKTKRSWPKSSFIHKRARIQGWKIKVGENVHIGDNCLLDSNSEWITIEDDVIIASDSHIHTHDAHTKTSAPVIIRRGSFIGAGTIILEGVEIGEHALIGAGTVIPKNKKIPSYSKAFSQKLRIERNE